MAAMETYIFKKQHVLQNGWCKIATTFLNSSKGAKHTIVLSFKIIFFS